MNREDLMDLLHLRKWSYYFFSINFLNSPDWKEIGKDENMEVIGSIFAQRELEDLKSILENLKNIERREIPLKEEYERLFLGNEKVLVSPWRSTYIGEEGIIFDENTLKIRNKYREYGLEYSSSSKEPDDHIAGILEFMIYLIDLSISQVDKENLYIELINEQKNFLKDFILDWIGSFNEDLQTEANEDYYKSLGKLLLLFLNSDIELIDKYLIN